MDIFEGVKKFTKRSRLENNKFSGKLTEEKYRVGRALEAYEVVRTGRGSDFKERKVNFLTGRKGPSTLVEVKYGNSKLSPLQRETQQNSKKYKVHRSKNLWF